MNDELLTDLAERLSDRSGRVRERARHTLVFIGPPAVPLLLERVGSKAKRTRWEVAKTLSEIADPASMPALVRLLSDPESDIRWIAAEGLIRLGARSIPDVLRLLIDKPESTDIRRAAHHVLHELSADNLVVAETVAPVMKVLGDTEPASSLPPKAEEVLRNIDWLLRGDSLA